MISKKLSIVHCQLSIILAFLPLSVAYAQQDSTLNRTVVVENEYNPNIMDASKINVLPRVEEPAVMKKGIEYATALRPVSAWTYESMSPITREWAMNRAKRGYVRAGYGNYGNVDFKAGYLWNITGKDRLKVGVSLDGMNGKLKHWNAEDWKSRFYSTEFRLDYSHDFSKVTLNLGGGLQSQVFNYMPDSEMHTASARATDKQHHTLGDFHIGVSSRDESLPLQFTLQTGLKYFGIKYPLDYSGNASTGKEKIVHTKAEYLFSESYVLYLHALGGRELNDYRRLNAFSPYWSLNARMPSTYVPLNATLGFKASPVNGLWFNVFGGYRISKDELFCNLVDADGYYFTHFLQDKAKTAYGGAELKYGYKDWFDASLKGTFYSWKTDNENEELYLVTKPKFELNFYAEAKVFEGLKVNLGYEYVQRKEYVIEEGNSSRDFGLGNISNLSVGASYTFLKDLSVFGRVNNLLNKQYYYEYGYPAEKLNVLTGLSLAF